MKLIYLVLLLIVVTFATGCPNKPSVDFDNPNSFISKLNVYLKTAQYECDCLSRQHTLKDSETGECNDDDVPNGPNEAKTVRDNAIDRAVPVIDDMYSAFVRNIENRRSKTDFFADVIELGASSAIGITNGGQRPLQILGVALTWFRGGRKSSDLNFYKQQTTPILINKMDGNRAQVLTIIAQNQEKPINEYSMGKAVKNLVDYYNAGTLVSAFKELSKDTASQTKTSEDTVRRIRGEDLTVSTIRSKVHIDLSKEILRQRRVLAKQLADAKRIVIPAASEPPTAENSAEIERAEADKTEKLNAARLKLEEVWNEVLADEAFAPTVHEMKASPNFAATFAALEAADITPDKAGDAFIKLINGLNAKIQENPELREKLLAILLRVNE